MYVCLLLCFLFLGLMVGCWVLLFLEFLVGV